MYDKAAKMTSNKVNTSIVLIRTTLFREKFEGIGNCILLSVGLYKNIIPQIVRTVKLIPERKQGTCKKQIPCCIICLESESDATPIYLHNKIFKKLAF